MIQGSQWQYIDPEGKQQGPFDAKKLLNWVDLGYFGQTDLQVLAYAQPAFHSGVAMRQLDSRRPPSCFQDLNLLYNVADGEYDPAVLQLLRSSTSAQPFFTKAQISPCALLRRLLDKHVCCNGVRSAGQSVYANCAVQVRQQGNEEWGPLVEALPKIRQQAAGDAPDEHDRAKEPLRNSFNRNSDDQPRGRGRGRNFGRGRRFQQEDNDLLPVMPEVHWNKAQAPRTTNSTFVWGFLSTTVPPGWC